MNNSVSPSAGRWRKIELTKLHSGFLSVTFSEEAAVGSILHQTVGLPAPSPVYFGDEERKPLVCSGRTNFCLCACYSIDAQGCVGAIAGAGAEGAEQEQRLPAEGLRPLACPFPAFGHGTVRFRVVFDGFKGLFQSK